jgi:alpha-tubulin suppressor-like RCC1 family protein
MAAAVVTVLAAALLMAVGQAEASAATNNTVMAWGDDSYGLLGNADGGEFSAVPLAVSALSGLTVTAVSAGGDHSVALLSDGKVMAWGSGVYGELGDGKVPGGAVQLNLPPDVTVTAVSAGGEYSLALLSNGTVMAWGRNEYGQLGDESTEMCDGSACSETPVAVCAVEATPPCSQADGNLLEEVTAVSAGYGDSLARLKNGTVVAWGYNSAGELGDGTNTGPDLCGGSYPCSETPVAVCAVGATAPCSHANGNLLEGVAAVSAAGRQSMALLSTERVVAWGVGGSGELGNGTPTDYTEMPVAVCAVEATAPCSQAHGNLLEGVKAISAGAGHDLALLNTDTVTAWGENGYGQLGNKSTEECPHGGAACSATPVPVCAVEATAPCSEANGNLLEEVKAISAGGNLSLALLSSGAITAWGSNRHGALGNGSTAEYDSDVPAAVCEMGATLAFGETCSESKQDLLEGVEAISTNGADSLALLGTPTVATITPNSGPTAGGTTVAIRGSDFERFGAIKIFIGSAEATDVKVFGEEEIEATTPAGAAGPVEVRVEIVADHVSSTGGPAYTYVAPPPPTPPPPPPPHGGGLASPLGLTLTAVTLAQIKTLLSGEITPSGKTATIADVLKSGFSISFTALEAGNAVIDWYEVPSGAHLAKKTKPKPVLVASGQRSFSAAGKATIKIRLTAGGKRLLKHARQIKLTAKGTFTPTAMAPVSATHAFVLKR